MLDFITKFFRREEASKTLAKERLRLVLMSDRVSLAPETFDEMKSEMLSVIRRYLEIDEQALDMHFENLERQFALLASIPVLKVKPPSQVTRRRHTDAAAANGAAHAGSPAATNGSAAGTRPRRRRRRRRNAEGTVQDGPGSSGAAPPPAPG